MPADLDLVQIAANYMAIALYQTELHKRLGQAEQTEIALRESEERYKVLANTVFQCVWMITPDASAEYCNRHWPDYSVLTLEATSIYLRDKLALDAGLKATLGIPIVANNRVLAVLVFCMFEAREEDQRLIELISASTELGLFIQRKQAEGEVRKSLLKERELNWLKFDFISTVSHEFCTFLSSIILSTELLETYWQRSNEVRRQIYFRRTQNSTQRITQLLEN